MHLLVLSRYYQRYCVLGLHFNASLSAAIHMHYATAPLYFRRFWVCAGLTFQCWRGPIHSMLLCTQSARSYCQKYFQKLLPKLLPKYYQRYWVWARFTFQLLHSMVAYAHKQFSARSHCQKYCQVMTKVITKMLSQVLISMAPLNGSMVVYAHKEGSSSYYSEVARLTLASGEAIEASKRNYHHTITLPLPHLLQGTAEIFPKILHLVGPSGRSVTTVGLQRQHHRGCATIITPTQY